MNIADYLSETAIKNGLDPNTLQLPNPDIDPDKVKVMMISEVPPQNPEDDFYSAVANPGYMRTTRGISLSKQSAVW